MKIRNVKTAHLKVESHRNDYGDLSSLAKSIETYGLIHPLVVEPCSLNEQGEQLYLLIAGRRRFKASALSGMIELPCVLREDLTPQLRKELELEENLHRKNLTWAEEVALKAEIDELKRQTYGHAMKGGDGDGWSRKKLAESLDESEGKVVQDLQLAAFLTKHPEEGQKLLHINKTAAFRKMKQFYQVKKMTERLNAGSLVLQENFENIDARIGLKKLKSNSADLLLTDPPWGDPRAQLCRLHTHVREYDNLPPKEAIELLTECAVEFYRILKPSSHFYVFTSFISLNSFQAALAKAGLCLDARPLIWAKGSNVVIGTGLAYMSSAELIIFGHKPGTERRCLNKNHIDVLTYPPKKGERCHAFEKPQDLLKFLISQSSNLGETVLDPFAGVASVHRACRILNRQPISFEIDKAHYAKGLELLK